MTVRIRSTLKHAEFLLPVGTHTGLSRLLRHTASSVSPGKPFNAEVPNISHIFLCISLSTGAVHLRAGEAITETISRDGRKLIKLMLRKCTFLPPPSHQNGQFVQRHLMTTRREKHVLEQWLRQYFMSRPRRAQCRHYEIPSTINPMFGTNEIVGKGRLKTLIN